MPPPADPAAVRSRPRRPAPAETTAAAPAEDGARTSATAPRVGIDTPRLTGSVSLLGGRIDELSLKTYRQTLAPDSDIVHLLIPAGEAGAFYAVHGWTAAQGLAAEDVSRPEHTVDAPADASLSVDTPLVLTWDNGKGQVFTREDRGG